MSIEIASGPGSAERPLRVAIVGSGPSGFYAAAALFKAEGLCVEVDMFDRLPTPFGLVRGGVAPDHQKIKNVIRVYNKTASHESFRFLGNVHIGRDIKVAVLSRHYDQVVWAIGNESDRRMNLPGEDLPGVHSATEFVGWYNGHPDFQHLDFDLAAAHSVAVVGNGNVSMDVARILAQPAEELAPTDITERALEALRKSSVEDIYILGRRGPAQAAFSPKEIKEVGSLEDCSLLVDKNDATLDELSSSWLEEHAPNSAKKNVAYLQEIAGTGTKDAKRRVHCRFLVSPVEFLGDGRLEKVRIEHNELHPDDRGTPRPRGTGQSEELAVDLVFKAVGYRGVPLEGLPFREDWGIVPNEAGRVQTSADGDVLPSHYVVGWAKRGPSGLIGTNGPDSQATVEVMIEDLLAGKLVEAEAPDRDAILAALEAANVDPVSFADWQRLDADEVERGEKVGKVREKYTDVEAMMNSVRRLRSPA